MKDLIISSFTERQLASFIKNPSHAMLLIGPKGSGKSTLIEYFASRILSRDTKNFSTYAYKMKLEPEEDKIFIGIEAVRELEHFLALVVPGSAKIKRVAVIDNAEKLTHQAQNALLKTLEEPPEDTIIIMATTHKGQLLPTIESRAQILSVTPPSESQINTFFSDKFSKEAIKQAYIISGGLPGLMSSLLNSSSDHQLYTATEMARNLLQQTTYERLQQLDVLADNKDLARDTIFILGQMAHVSLRKATGATRERWESIQKVSYEATKALDANTQPKLVLLDLLLNL